MVDLNNINGAIVELIPESINEGDLNDLIGLGSGDVRATSAAGGPYWDKWTYSKYLTYQDPKLYASWSFGNQLQDGLNGIGKGYGAEVADFGRYLTVKVTYSNPPTGKSSSKVFLIAFNPDGKKGNIFQNSNRYRTFSGLSQAISYIKSCVSSLRDKTN